MNKPLILITGATGKTGRSAVEHLLELGYPVRALARTHDDRSVRLESLGAEVVFGDIHDLEAIRRAFAGVSRAYFCYPPQGTHLVDATTIFAIAARDAGVNAVVNMTQISAREDAPSPLSRQHWQAEQVLNWASIGAVHIAATFFVENLFMFGAQTIAEQGKLYLPYGSAQHAPVSASDLASVISAVLANPDAHRGARYVITGPELMTVNEMAQVLSDGLGTDVEYVDLPSEAWQEALAAVPGMSPSLITHLGHVADDLKSGIFHAQNDLVAEITGTPAQSLADSIHQLGTEYGFAVTSGSP